MKFRGIQQALHWLFLAVGLFSLFMLSYSASTYLDYAKEGYGLRVSVSESWLNDDWLVLRLDVENPGGLDIELMGGNITLTDTYEIPFSTLPNGQPQTEPLDVVPGGERIEVLVWVHIGGYDLDSIRDLGAADILLDLELLVPARYATTHIVHREIGMEVRA
jgi:hypothetical protein